MIEKTYFRKHFTEIGDIFVELKKIGVRKNTSIPKISWEMDGETEVANLELTGGHELKLTRWKDNGSIYAFLTPSRASGLAFAKLSIRLEGSGWSVFRNITV